MPIKCKTDISKIFAQIDAKTELARQDFQDAFELTCRELVNRAKGVNTYKDQTNNLRSSIGFVVYDNGEKITEQFTKGGKGVDGDGAKGIQEAMMEAEIAAKKYPNALVGIIVAGMEYAMYVEAKGYDVITGSCTQAKQILESYIKAMK